MFDTTKTWMAEANPVLEKWQDHIRDLIRTSTTSCSICNDNKGFKFDYSNVGLEQVDNAELIKLPPIEQCISLPNATV